jgi:hypothetical protein
MSSTQHISTMIESVTAPGGLKSHTMLGFPAPSADWRRATLGSRRIQHSTSITITIPWSWCPKDEGEKMVFFLQDTNGMLLCTPGLWCIAHINPVILPVSLTICAWQSRLNWIYALRISLTSAVVPRILNSQRPCKSAMIYVKSPMSYRWRLWRSKRPRKAARTRSFYRRTTC